MRRFVGVLAVALVTFTAGLGLAGAADLAVPTPSAPQPSAPAAIVPAPSGTPPGSRWDYAFIPVVFYAPEASVGFAVGAAVFGDAPAPPGLPRRDDNASILLQGTLRKQFTVGVSGVKFWDDARYQLTEDATWVRFPSYFWGIGDDTPESARELYTQSLATMRSSLAVRVPEEIYAGLGVGVGWYGTSGVAPAGTVASYLDAVGSRGGVVGAGPVLRRDTRDDAIGPHRGSLTALAATFFTDALSGGYRYQTYDLDQRTFVRLGDWSVLAMEAYGLYAPGNVPLAELPALGGSSRLRGYYQGRFRDHLYVMGQLEWRVRVAGRLSVAPFAAAGNVFPDPSALSLERPKVAAGGAIRFSLKKERDLNIHLDVAKSPISSGVYLNLGEAF